jgi:hypothetical protein
VHARVEAALIDGDQTSIVELREGDPKLAALVREAEDSEIVAGRGRKGKRARSSFAPTPVCTGGLLCSTIGAPVLRATHTKEAPDVRTAVRPRP